MTTEMDLLHMDERQRLAWLMANRGTLIFVGAVWIGLIVWELAHERMPLFLIAMVPVIALIRAGLFFYYSSTPSDPSAFAGRTRRARKGKTVAALLLASAFFLPIYWHAGATAEDAREYGFSWDLFRDDAEFLFVLPMVLLWPVVTLALSRFSSRRPLAIAVHVAEPLLAAGSVLLLLWIPHFHWQARTIWIFFLGFESARPAVGTLLAVAANGLYFVVWLWETLRPGS